MESVTVSTKEELQRAKDAGATEIMIVGDLADQVHNGRQIITTGSAALGIIAAAIVAIPFTLGLSIAVAGPIALAAGVEVPLVLAVMFVGAALLIAIWTDYDEVEYRRGKLVLRRK